MARIDHTEKEFIESYRMNFKNWRIVDIDNFMQGNSFFPKVKVERVWREETAKITGTKENPFNYLSETGPVPDIGLDVTA